MGSGAGSPYQGADSPCQGEMSRRDKRGREMARRARGGRESDYEHEVLAVSEGVFPSFSSWKRKVAARDSGC